MQLHKKMYHSLTQENPNLLIWLSPTKCLYWQKQPSRGVPRKKCSENMQQIYRRAPMPKCDFNSNFIEITLRYGYSPVNILHIFRTPFLRAPLNGNFWRCIASLTFISFSKVLLATEWRFRVFSLQLYTIIPMHRLQTMSPKPYLADQLYH